MHVLVKIVYHLGKKTEQNESKIETTEIVEKPKRGRPPKSKSNSINSMLLFKKYFVFI